MPTDAPLWREPNDLALGGFSDRQTMRFVRDYPHPPALVWAAITDPAQLGVWLWTCKRLESRVGGVALFDVSGKEVTLPVAAFEPERRLDLGGRMIFTLEATQQGCRLTFDLKRPPDGWSPMGLAGFHGWLGRLGRLLAHRPRDETETWAGGVWNAVFAHYEWEVSRHVAGGARVLWRVHFGAGDAALSDEAKAQLDDLARLLQETGLAVTIDGFGDDPGEMAASVALCGRRVAAAVARLMAAGVPEGHINIGYVLGNYHLLAPSETEAARAYNRRIELRPVY